MSTTGGDTINSLKSLLNIQPTQWDVETWSLQCSNTENEQRDVWCSISKACDIKKYLHIVEFSNERKVIGSTEKTQKNYSMGIEKFYKRITMVELVKFEGREWRTETSVAAVIQLKTVRAHHQRSEPGLAQSSLCDQLVVLWYVYSTGSRTPMGAHRLPAHIPWLVTTDYRDYYSNL